jgi:hypothetical protein
MTKTIKKPKSAPLLSRSEVVGLCKRFLKDGLYNPSRDPMIMYKVIKGYPNRAFWLNMDLTFRLNSLFWLLGKDGQERLAADWATFWLDIPAQPEYTLEQAKVGEDIVVDKKPKTVADLLKSSAR